MKNMTTMIGEGNSKSRSEGEVDRKIHLPTRRSPEKMNSVKKKKKKKSGGPEEEWSE